MPSGAVNFTVNDLMLSVETNFTSFIGLSSEGVYSTESVGWELSNGVLDVGLKSSTFPVLSLTDNSLLGINVGDSIPSVISQTGVVLAVPVKQQKLQSISAAVSYVCQKYFSTKHVLLTQKVMVHIFIQM